jgi:hypothetical protein
MNLFRIIRPEETDIHAMLEATAMMAGERPKIENLCQSSSFDVLIIDLYFVVVRRGCSSPSKGEDGDISRFATWLLTEATVLFRN